MKKYHGLKIPVVKKISGRASTITGTFINGIIPFIEPEEKTTKTILKALKQDSRNLHCVYCGKDATEWDHFHNLVKNKRPTGYITEPFNLVPSCGTCNQSRGAQEFAKWMRGDAPKSPSKKLKKSGLEKRIKLLQQFEKKFNRIRLDVRTVERTKEWKELEKIREKINCELKKADLLTGKLRNKLLSQIRSSG